MTVDIETLNDTMKRTIDLGTNSIYIVCNGDITVLDEMAHGTDTIHWNKGNVDVVRAERIRLGNKGKNISGTLVKADNL